MLVNFLRNLILLSIGMYVSCSFADNKVVVVPSSDGMVVIPLPAEKVILFDELSDGKSSGQVIGGTFTSKGWKHVSGEDKIIWDLDQTMEAGIIEFELTGMSKDTKGGYSTPRRQRAYYFGLFNDPTGDKKKGGTNPAFIEIRYNWGSDYKNRSAVKFQAGDAGLSGTFHEPYGTKKYQDWNPNAYYKHKVTFGDGLTTLYIDGEFQAEIPYNNRPLGWRYLFIGDINYAGISGPDNVTYRNVKVTKIK